MKKFFTTLFLGLLLGCFNSVYALSGDVKTLVDCGKDDANTSITVASAVTNRKFRIMGLFLSTDSADEILLKTGVSTKLGLHLAANSGLSQILYPLSVDGVDNEALTISKSASTDLHYCVWYSEE